MPRPSSPLSAKASTRCPSLALDRRRLPVGSAKPRPGQTGKRRTKPPRTGAKPRCSRTGGRAASHEDTISDMPTPSRPGPVRLGHMTTLSSPFNQHPRPNWPRTGVVGAPPNVAHHRRSTPPLSALLSATPVARPQRGCDRGGGERIRTDDLLLAKQALSQLSYTPLPEIRDQNTEIRV